MIGYIKEGWKEAARQPFLLVLLFVYRLVWGIVLYRTVQSVVVPLMHRYAGGISKSQVQLFLAEGEFQLTKTDLSHSYLWMLLAIMLARMFVTPLLNAGVYYSLSHPHLNMGYRFFKGIRELGRSFFLLYLVQMLLTAAPAYFLLPRVTKLLEHYNTLPETYRSLLPWLAGYVLYGFLLHLFFMHLQFGRTERASLFSSLLVPLKGLLPVLSVAALLLLVSALLSGLVFAGTMIWAGFWALMAYQAYGFIRTFLSLWGITSQHRLFIQSHA